MSQDISRWEDIRTIGVAWDGSTCHHGSVFVIYSSVLEIKSNSVAKRESIGYMCRNGRWWSGLGLSDVHIARFCSGHLCEKMILVHLKFLILVVTCCNCWSVGVPFTVFRIWSRPGWRICGGRSRIYVWFQKLTQEHRWFTLSCDM